ncbi:MAG TPA: glycosyltransferase family 39 protein [Fimbriiglobus sp.]|nr:glycosyltransferase family 39 protein [Fimbriiglobus sp.]
MATDVHIGGRLEAVAPRRVTDTSDRVRLLTLLAVAVAVHGWVLTHTTVTARDSIGFARTALQFERPADAGMRDVVDVLTNSQHPPGYPLAVLAASLPVRAAYDADLPDQMLKSAQVASCVAAVLLVFPTYWLGRLLFGKFAGFAAALLFQVLPVPAEVLSDGLTEGLYLLGLGTALLLGTRAIKKPGVGGFLLCGLATGLTYLVRPEGLLAAVAVGLVAVALGVVGRWPRAQAAAGVAALAVGTVLPAVPYMVLIEGITNKPAGKAIFQGIFKSPRQAIATGETSAAPHAGPPVAAWYVPGEDGSLPAWVAAAVTKETTKAFHYFPAAMAVLGVVLAVRRLRAEPWVWVPLVYGAVIVAVVVAMASVGQSGEGGRQHYVSERHTLPLVYVGCFFAALGIEKLPGLWVRVSLVGRWPGHPAVSWAILLGIVISAVPKLAQPLHANRAGHVHAGRFLRDHLHDGDTLIDPFEWAQYYSGRAVRTIPPDPPPVAGRFRWAVLEPNESPHSRLHRLQPALDVANDGKNKAVKAFWWPEGPVEDAKVVVYKQRITEADEAAYKAARKAAGR